MPHRIKNWLEDIRICICNIENFLGSRHDFFEYERNILLRHGVERNLITHGYDEVSDERIWAIIINQLPRLKEEVDQLLNSDNN